MRWLFMVAVLVGMSNHSARATTWAALPPVKPFSERQGLR